MFNTIQCLLLLFVLSQSQDLPWAGLYNASAVFMQNGNDPSQCCVPQVVIISQDVNDSKLLTIEMNFGLNGSENCDSSLVGIIGIQQRSSVGRLTINQNNLTALHGSIFYYMLNNCTVLWTHPNGCHVEWTTAKSFKTNGLDIDYANRYSGLWVMQYVYPAEPLQISCCNSLQPIASSFDSYTMTRSWIEAYPNDPICPQAVRNTVSFGNSSVVSGGRIVDDLAEFMLPNGSIITLRPAPYCNIIWTVKKLTANAIICDYVDNSVYRLSITTTSDTISNSDTGKTIDRTTMDEESENSGILGTIVDNSIIGSTQNVLPLDGGLG
jgi:hypothetical protein